MLALVAIAFAAATLSGVEAADSQQNRPNIILCMADDLGWGDVGYNGHPHIKTPNLDTMAKAGARLDRFYVGSPLCVMSRAGLLTGRIATRCGISNHRGSVSHLRDEEITIPELLKTKGYTTGHFGKWHLGMLTADYKGDKTVLMTPGMSGSDQWFATPSSVSTYDPYIDPGGIARATGKESAPKTIDLRAGFIHNGKRSGGAVDFDGKKFELFDLLDDPGERTDVALMHPEIVATMRSQLRQWIGSVERSRSGMDYESAARSESPQLTSEKRVHLFLCSGQSNMKNLDLSVSFTPALKKAFSDDEVIVTKVAYGGRPIARWVPRAKIYTELLKEAKSATAGRKVDTVTFVWMQGERDHQEDEATTAYRTNLEALYQQLTEDLGRNDINWVIGRLSDARLGTANWDKIRQIQVDVAESHPRAAWINTDDLNGSGDGVHCPPDGYKKMGLRFADKAIELINSAGEEKP